MGIVISSLNNEKRFAPEKFLILGRTAGGELIKK